MFNPDGSISSLFTVDETDTVASDGKTYKGMFDFKLWPPSYDAVGGGRQSQRSREPRPLLALSSIDQRQPRIVNAGQNGEGNCNPSPCPRPHRASTACEY